MPQRILTCGYCGRERYESRMVQGVMIVHYNRWSGEPDAFRPIEYWECSARASCKAARQVARKAAREQESETE